MKSTAERRDDMVRHQIANRGVHDERVLNAMREVPREEFVSDRMAGSAYDDMPLPIEKGQTISQPFIVALMADALELQPDDTVLEIGAGSGYSACVMSRCVRRVFAIERHASLVTVARERALRLGYDNVEILHGDGTLGWAEHAPYDAISVAAGGPDVPEPLLAQLAIGGRLVIPVGSTLNHLELVRIRRTDEQSYDRDSLGQVCFVPLIPNEA